MPLPYPGAEAVQAFIEQSIATSIFADRAPYQFVLELLDQSKEDTDEAAAYLQYWDFPGVQTDFHDFLLANKKPFLEPQAQAEQTQRVKREKEQAEEHIRLQREQQQQQERDRLQREQQQQQEQEERLLADLLEEAERDERAKQAKLQQQVAEQVAQDLKLKEAAKKQAKKQQKEEQQRRKAAEQDKQQRRKAHTEAEELRLFKQVQQRRQAEEQQKQQQAAEEKLQKEQAAEEAKLKQQRLAEYHALLHSYKQEKQRLRTLREEQAVTQLSVFTALVGTPSGTAQALSSIDAKLQQYEALLYDRIAEQYHGSHGVAAKAEAYAQQLHY
jgi:hypothetical protein